MKKLNMNKALGQVAMAAILVTALQCAANAQNNSGYYALVPTKNPIDLRMAVLYDRVDSMYNAGFFAPQEHAELIHDLDGIQCYEMRARCYNPMGMSRLASQALNRKLDFFTARLDARGSAS
jgi:hypothetical protein